MPFIFYTIHFAAVNVKKNISLNPALPQDLLGVSGLIQGDLVQTPLIDSNSIQGILTVGLPLWILSWPGGQRYSQEEGKAVG